MANMFPAIAGIAIQQNISAIQMQLALLQVRHQFAFGAIGSYAPMLMGCFGGFGYGAGFGMAGIGMGYSAHMALTQTNFNYYRELKTESIYKDYKMQDVWLKESVNRWRRWSDPVMIDLDGNGKIDLQDKRGVFRWETGNWWRGERHSINQWVKPKGDKTDGVLVTLNDQQLKAYQQGKEVKVDYRRNLFGEYDKNGVKRYRNGYEKLRAYYDKNHDGVIDEKEIKQAKDLYVWQDKDGDGKIDQGELFRPEELGIKKFDTNKNSYTREVGKRYYYEEGIGNFPLRRAEWFQVHPQALRTLNADELTKLFSTFRPSYHDNSWLLLMLLQNAFTMMNFFPMMGMGGFFPGFPTLNFTYNSVNVNTTVVQAQQQSTVPQEPVPGTAIPHNPHIHGHGPEIYAV